MKGLERFPLVLVVILATEKDVGDDDDDDGDGDDGDEDGETVDDSIDSCDCQAFPARGVSDQPDRAAEKLPMGHLISSSTHQHPLRDMI